MKKESELRPMLKSRQPMSQGFIFILLLGVNMVLSYSGLSAGIQIVLGFLGPLLLLTSQREPASFPVLSLERREFLPAFSIGLWGLLAILALGLRLYRLSTLSVWPLYDEGMYGDYAIHLSNQWTWQFFFGPSQAPPFYLWLLGLFFKTFGISLTTLWLLPALISSLLLPAGYWAARGFFSRSFSTLCALLMGFSFWPLYVGRFSLMTGLVLLAECLTLGCLGRLVTMKNPSTLAVFTLGLFTGLGFYTYLHWPALALVVLATFLSWMHYRRGRNLGFFPYLYFFIPLLLALIPLAWGLGREGAEQLFFYLGHLTASYRTLSGLDQAGISVSYIASLFWGMDLKFHTYQPVWGGYLNPVLDTFFFLGLVGTLRRWKEPLSFWLLVSLVCFILPGLLTSERATSRMILVVPVLFILIGRGLSTFGNGKSVNKLMVGLAVLSLGFDLYHLMFAYPNIWRSMDHWKGYEKSYARYQAYLKLEPMAAEKGPGFVFGDFVPSLADQTLTVATFGFNALQNPSIHPDQGKWAAVLTNVHFQPFLNHRFPGGKAYWVSKDLMSPDGGWMLWVFPVTPADRGTIEHWQAASRSLDGFNEKSLCYVPGQSFEDMTKALEKVYPYFQGDPFLESCYWEKRADLSQRQALQETGDSASLDWARSAQLLTTALQKGYPAAHLYRDLGVDDLMLNDPSKARIYLEKARHCPLDFTDARKLLNE